MSILFKHLIIILSTYGAAPITHPPVHTAHLTCTPRVPADSCITTKIYVDNQTDATYTTQFDGKPGPDIAPHFTGTLSIDHGVAALKVSVKNYRAFVWFDLTTPAGVETRYDAAALFDELGGARSLALCISSGC